MEEMFRSPITVRLGISCHDCGSTGRTSLLLAQAGISLHDTRSNLVSRCNTSIADSELLHLSTSRTLLIGCLGVKPISCNNWSDLVNRHITGIRETDFHNIATGRGSPPLLIYSRELTILRSIRKHTYLGPFFLNHTLM